MVDKMEKDKTVEELKAEVDALEKEANEEETKEQLLAKKAELQKKLFFKKNKLIKVLNAGSRIGTSIGKTAVGIGKALEPIARTGYGLGQNLANNVYPEEQAQARRRKHKRKASVRHRR